MLEAVRLKAVGGATRPDGVAREGSGEVSLARVQDKLHEVERGQRQKALQDQ